MEYYIKQNMDKGNILLIMYIFSICSILRNIKQF